MPFLGRIPSLNNFSGPRLSPDGKYSRKSGLGSRLSGSKSTILPFFCSILLGASAESVLYFASSTGCGVCLCCRQAHFWEG